MAVVEIGEEKLLIDLYLIIIDIEVGQSLPLIGATNLVASMEGMHANSRVMYFVLPAESCKPTGSACELSARMGLASRSVTTVTRRLCRWSLAIPREPAD